MNLKLSAWRRSHGIRYTATCGTLLMKGVLDGHQQKHVLPLTRKALGSYEKSPKTSC